ncbi:MAG: choice-of-anchor P family protein [Actinomycetota bacterium]
MATALLMIVSGVGGLFLTSGTAAADVDAVEGTGYAISVSLLGAAVVPPAPDPTVTPPRLVANESSTEFGPLTSSILTVGPVLGVLDNGVQAGPVVTQAGNIVGENHFGFISTTSQVANVSLLTNAIEIPLIQSSCVSNGDGSTGATTVSNARLGTEPLLDGPIAPNTVVDLLGLATIVLNEQIVSGSPPVGMNPGTTQITVRGARISIPNNGSVAEVILAESFCRADGPNVLVPQTTTTTASTTTTTAPPATTTTTAPPATTTTTAPPATTTTTVPATTTTTSPPTGTTAVPTSTTSPPTTVGSGVLVRTGSTLQPLAIMSGLSIVIGILLLIGSGRPLTANASASGGMAYGPVAGNGPDKWGPVEIGKTIWAGLAALVVGAAEMSGGRRKRRRE